MQRSMVRPSPVFLGILAVTVLGGVLAAVGDELGGVTVTTGTVLLVLGGWGVSLCLHEFGHAIVAYRGGDREVYFKGYLTLDPRRYTDPVLSLVIPLVLLAIGGIPLPGGAVWINHHALRSRAVETMVSLAGPLSNLALGTLLIISVELFDPSLGLASALSFLALLQIFAFVLNILPIPGLDGWGAIEPYLSPQAQRIGAKARPWAPLVLFAVLIGIPDVARGFFKIADLVFTTLGGTGFLASVGREIFFFWQR
ncbi:site-2 protease family protein [Actinophytocola sp.]|uniref:site-2 protease family protein n=1 Tax=Actinophytocola sp. TaxID=1872138 RepID=UPI002D7F2CB8|nr:site-2 protease family protein [Actinophytocola sp.]HET9140913.1 site-2 protease family protein [Actinophytocola sp.]